MSKQIENIPLSDLEALDTDLQIRCENDPDQIDNIKEAIEKGERLPPIVLFQEHNEKFHIADGWHRYYAHREKKTKTIEAYVHEGTKEDALKYALGANANHGLRRTNQDKRNAVLIALKSHNAIFKTDKIKNVAVAELCKVAESFVRKIRKEQSATVKPSVTTGTGSSDANEPKIAQCDFFAELDDTCRQFSETFKEALNHTYFLSPEIEQSQKIQTIEAIEKDLKKHQQALLDLKAKLKAQEK